MKQKILLNSFMFLMFLAMLSSATLASASEVTGNLSSSGNNNQSTETTTDTGAHSSNGGGGGTTPDNGSLAGSVGSTSSNSTTSPESRSGTNNNAGNVLGESTVKNTSAPAKTSPKSLSSAKSANAATVYEAKFITLIDDPIAYEANGKGAQVASAFGAFSEFSAANWFWIIVLSLILLAVIAYIYNDDKKQAQSTRLNY
jgi:hypothetical protein